MTFPSVSSLRFYGRTLGKKISSRGRALLMQENERFVREGQAVDKTLWPRSVQNRCLEIGFGGGEHMLEQLTRNPESSFLGIEPFQNGLTKVLSRIEDNPPLKERLRLSSVPVQRLWPNIPDHFFHEIFVLFPDPWPKKRHHKRRLLQGQNLTQMIRVLAIGGHLKIASDDSDYIEFILENMKAHPELSQTSGARSRNPDIWPAWPDTWPLTRYGHKALAQGKSLAHLVFKQIS